MRSTEYYDKNAEALCEQYDSVDPSFVHSGWKQLIKNNKGLACDIGAGSRDANWLAEQSWDVIAVAPSSAIGGMVLQIIAFPKGAAGNGTGGHRLVAGLRTRAVLNQC